MANDFQVQAVFVHFELLRIVLTQTKRLEQTNLAVTVTGYLKTRLPIVKF